MKKIGKWCRTRVEEVEELWCVSGQWWSVNEFFFFKAFLFEADIKLIRYEKQNCLKIAERNILLTCSSTLHLA